jgi:cell wall-associated NlpC family hydrolase/uncharacterized protein YgiM (DUF1202 family)
MRKPLLALSLALTTSFGALPVAETLAATPSSKNPPAQTTPGTSTPANTAPGLSTYSRSPNAVSGGAIISVALKYLGYPYTATGNSPSTGFSCIGFVSFVYRSNGIPLPGDLGNAMAYAQQVPFSNLLPGDILYFQNTVWTGLSHAAIYLGGGKFVHAEYYGKGVRVSSFYNDRDDGNYWIGHYLGANRPWGGAATGSVNVTTAPTTSSVQTSVGPTTSAVRTLPNGPTALVTVSSLNVRTGPSKKNSVQSVVARGTPVAILSRSGSWIKVQLADGTVGWVVAEGIGQGQPQTTAVQQSAGGAPVAPQRQGALPASNFKTTAVKVASLNVRSTPSTGGQIVSSVPKGTKLQIVSRSGNWIKVQLADGTYGWIMAAFTSAKSKVSRTGVTASTTRTTARTQVVKSGPKARVAMNVRSGPSISNSVVAVVAPGATYRILGWSGGWARVRTSNGAVGYVSGTVLGKPSTTSYNSYTAAKPVKRATKRTSSYTSGPVMTAGVRVHSAPGVKAPVVGLVAAGTHVRVLGYRSGWTLIRLANGTTGYVLGTYIR